MWKFEHENTGLAHIFCFWDVIRIFLISFHCFSSIFENCSAWPSYWDSCIVRAKKYLDICMELTLIVIIYSIIHFLDNIKMNLNQLTYKVHIVTSNINNHTKEEFERYWLVALHLKTSIKNFVQVKNDFYSFCDYPTHHLLLIDRKMMIISGM